MTDPLLPVTGSIPVVRGSLVAVLVTRGPTPWLPSTLAALAAQTRVPTRVVVVDARPRDDGVTGVLPPDDAVARLARRTLDEVAPLWAVAAPGARTFGDAVRRALAVPGVLDGPGGSGPADATRSAPGPAGGRPGSRPAEAADWLWLLHDDSAPEPDALAELVRAVEHAPSVGVAGVKQRSWDEPVRLLEVGLTTSRLGRRMTGVEDGEVDQGQHDGREDVLGVGLAGALVRRDVWDELGGPDPALGPFGDGLDLSRRARLAGHRVVVVPRAVVRHAQASYAGLRDDDLLHVLTGADAHGGPPHRGAAGPGTTPRVRAADPRRSYAARRRAHVHARLASVPVVLLPLLTIAFLVAAVVRSLGRVAAKEGMLAAAELAAPVVAVLHPARMARSRAVARRARRLPRRSLRALQSTWRDVYREERDSALARVEARRVVQAPSELEIAELATLARRRRAGLAALVVVLAGLTVAALGRLAVAAAGGQALVGGGLLPQGGDVGDLWHAVTSGWTTLGLGVAAPADPLLAVLLAVGALTGGGAQAAVHVLFLGALPFAGLGAWFAAGAATRSVPLRLWAAIVWVAVPAVLLAVDDGRLGAVVAHAALPWAALGVARALGVQRTDVVVPGLVDARTAPDDAAPEPGPGADAAGGDDDAASVRAAASTAEASTAHASTAEASTAHASTGAASTGDASTGALSTAHALTVDAGTGGPGSSPAAVPHAAPGRMAASGRGSTTAAAAAGLALAVAVAGAPLLLPAAVLALLGVALAARDGRRRLVLVALPALALAGPLVAHAVDRAGTGGWRALLAEPGLAVDSAAAPAWQQLLGWPVTPAADLAPLVGADVGGVLPFVLGGTVVVLALLALLRGAGVSRGVRAGWWVAACGLAAGVVAGRVATAAVDGAVVRGWSGAGVSLAVLGLLVAATLGADGTRERVARRAFGWRQAAVALATGLAVVAPLVPLTEWLVRSGPAAAAPASSVHGVPGPVVPAVGQQAQTSAARSRVLTLGVEGSGEVRYGLLRGDGPQLAERSAAAAVRRLPGDPADLTLAPVDAATAEVEALVARLATGAPGDVSGDLGALAVGAVLVPPAVDEATEPARSELVGRLDSTGGLERITENPTGVIWRVVAPAGADVAPAAGAGTVPSGTPPLSAWARLVTPGEDGSVTAEELPADARGARATVPAGAGDRTVVLAERADPGWRAWLDGRPLRTVDAGWRQAFALGDDGGRLTVAYAPPARQVWGVVQAVVLGLTLLLALPVRRRRGGAR